MLHIRSTPTRQLVAGTISLWLANLPVPDHDPRSRRGQPVTSRTGRRPGWYEAVVTGDRPCRPARSPLESVTSPQPRPSAWQPPSPRRPIPGEDDECDGGSDRASGGRQRGSSRRRDRRRDGRRRAAAPRARRPLHEAGPEEPDPDRGARPAHRRAAFDAGANDQETGRLDRPCEPDENYGLFFVPERPTPDEEAQLTWRPGSDAEGQIEFDVIIRGRITIDGLRIDCNMGNQGLAPSPPAPNVAEHS